MTLVYSVKFNVDKIVSNLFDIPAYADAFDGGADGPAGVGCISL